MCTYITKYVVVISKEEEKRGAKKVASFSRNGVCDIEDPSIGALEISVLFGQPAWLEAESYFKHGTTFASISVSLSLFNRSIGILKN